MSRLSVDYTKGDIRKHLLSFAVPFLLSALLQNLNSIVNMVIVGIYLDKQGLSAVSTGAQLVLTITNILIGFSMGGTVLIAQYGGRQDISQQQKTIGTLLTLFAAVGVVLTAVLTLLNPALIRMLQTPKEAFAEASAYLYISMGGVIITLIYNALSAVQRGLGDSKRPLYFIAIAVVINIFLDLLFIAILRLPARTAAISTLISQFISLVLAIRYLRSRDFIFDFSLKSFIPDKQKIKAILSIGVPSALQQAFVHFSFTILMGIINTLGVDASAAYGTGAKINAFVFMVPLSMMSAMAAFVGQNIGAKQYDRVRKAVFTGMRLAFPAALVLCGLMVAFAPVLARFFTHDPNVIALCTLYLRSGFGDSLVCSILFCFNGMIVGSGHTRFALINSALSGLIIRVPLAYLLIKMLGMGMLGAGITASLSPIVSLIVGALYYRSNRWQKSVMA